MATLVDEWFRLGLRDVVICPGSRSTPMTMAFARHGGVSAHVRIDERSAAFFALGRALSSRRPVAIVVTSGTAAAEVHAAVAEADLAGVPVMVITADRPPELHGVGAPQTIDQQRLYGSKVRLYEEPGIARLDASTSWRPLARRL
ncbi:MAG: 2-succinyl-5-enolpyruvyl-6-hydroxy-3-cyclohexene-1-carboxylate synthase, partial [Acidobacteria bacterium]|nr:2-succinyl-5-enolpyruvyl-6-hydroxy-3-cyclohexene-1-carboxylate synthase [Acidobacteriota bacterium]